MYTRKAGGLLGNVMAFQVIASVVSVCVESPGNEAEKKEIGGVI